MLAKKWMIGLASGLVGAAVLVATVFRTSDEERIRQVLDRTCKAVRVKDDDNPIVRLGRVRSEFAELVQDDIRADISEVKARVVGRAELVDAAMKVSAIYSSGQCEIVSPRIKIDDAATTAKVDAIAVVTGYRAGAQRTDQRDVHFLLRKDGGWKITTIDVQPAREP